MRTLLQWGISLVIAYGAFKTFTTFFPGVKDALRTEQSRLTSTSPFQRVRRVLKNIELVLLLFILTTVIRAFLLWQFDWGF